MEREHEYVLRTVEERRVRLVRLWFTDVTGQLKSFAITPAELETAFEEGIHFDGSAIDGFSRIQENDVLAKPDPTTFELLPWTHEDENSARMFCSIETVDGVPFAGDSRHVLQRNLASAREHGFTFMCAPEMEFFYFDGSDPRQLVPLDQGGYFDLTTADVSNDLRRRTIHVLETMGIPVEYSFHEDSPSQHEIDLRYTNALEMADNIVTFRLVVREIALERGVFATFMPKPIAGLQGSGMHTHLSLFEGDTNAFHDPVTGELSATAGHFIAGLLVHAREITAITNQLVNSYKRLVIGYEAPSAISWAHNNRSALVRVPVTKANKPASTRIEYRSPDPACNPYLAYSVILAAGLKGITEGYELPDEATANIFEMSDDELAKSDLKPLPQSLGEALDEMEKSELVAHALGDHIFEWFLRNKREEFESYRAQVTPFELDRYLASW